MHVRKTTIAVLILTGLSSGQVTRRVSLSPNGEGAIADCFWPAISADGRFVCFSSPAGNLAGPTNGVAQVFLRDRVLGRTELVSVSTGGSPGNDASYTSSISADGRFVAFESFATNLVPGDTNQTWDIFLRDRLSGTTERVSVRVDGSELGGSSNQPSLSADGRYLAFTSDAADLVPGDGNGFPDVFVRDNRSGVVVRASVDSRGVEAVGQSIDPMISATGEFVVFSSEAPLVPGDTNWGFDVFLRNLAAGTTERVDLSSSGAQAIPVFDFDDPCSVSADGRIVAFGSEAANLVPGDTSGSSDVFVHDCIRGTTVRADVSTSGAPAWPDAFMPSLSADGRYVSFDSFASNLVPGDTNATNDVFVRDLVLGTTERVSLSTSGAEPNNESAWSAISSDGRFVAFLSRATNLDSMYSYGSWNVFIRDRHASAFTSLCAPGVDGVTACPCANAPADRGRGCDNRSGTGGAELSASGAAYLSADSLVLSARDENRSSTSLLFQGRHLVSDGSVLGRGVSCIGGPTTVLFVKAAVEGTVAAPDFAAGDQSITDRSIARGDRIRPGQSRWYAFLYRDEVATGGCPATSTFNSTQTGRVDWSY